jgi:hypothetical protein
MQNCNSQTGSGWILCEVGIEQHIIPFNDLLDHEDEDCACFPSSELLTSAEGDVWQIVHNAWDGRQ